MTRSTYVYREGLGLVEKSKAPPLSGVFFVLRDGMDALAHPCTGELMDSKSAFRRVTRQHGCIEIGDQSNARKPDPFADKRETQDRKRDIADALRNPDRSPAMAEHHLRQTERWHR